MGDRRVAFVARHGVKHEYPPHLVNYRANLWAFRSLGVRQVLAPCAVGSLRPDLPAGHDRRARPTRRPDLGPGPHPLRPGGRRRPCLLRRPLLSAGAGGRPDQRIRPHRSWSDRRWHPRGRQRAPLLDPRRVGLARGPGLVAGRHDRPAGGVLGPGTGALLHVRRPRHRPRRRRRGWHGGQPAGGARDLRSQPDPAQGSAAERDRRACRPPSPTTRPAAPAGGPSTALRCRSSCPDHAVRAARGSSRHPRTARCRPGHWPRSAPGRSGSTSTCRSARAGAGTATSTPTPPPSSAALPAPTAAASSTPRSPSSTSPTRVLMRAVPEVETIFVGGGTPTVLHADDLGYLVGNVDATASGCAEDAEITTEANPESIDASRPGPAGRAVVHPDLVRHAVGRPARARHPGPGALPRPAGPGGRRGQGRRIRPRQSRPDLRHAGGVAGRLARQPGDRRSPPSPTTSARTPWWSSPAPGSPPASGAGSCRRPTRTTSPTSTCWPRRC